MEPLMGLKLSGYVWREDNQPLDSDEFYTAFIDFIESRNLLFGGTFTQVDLNETDGVQIEL